MCSTCWQRGKQAVNRLRASETWRTVTAGVQQEREREGESLTNFQRPWFSIIFIAESQFSTNTFSKSSTKRKISKNIENYKEIKKFNRFFGTFSASRTLADKPVLINARLYLETIQGSYHRLARRAANCQVHSDTFEQESCCKQWSRESPSSAGVRSTWILDFDLGFIHRRMFAAL